MRTDEDPQDIIEHLNTGSELRVVPQTKEGRPLPSHDPEMEAIREDMKRRYRVTRERIEAGDDTPDAA